MPPIALCMWKYRTVHYVCVTFLNVNYIYAFYKLLPGDGKLISCEFRTIRRNWYNWCSIGRTPKNTKCLSNNKSNFFFMKREEVRENIYSPLTDWINPKTASAVLSVSFTIGRVFSKKKKRARERRTFRSEWVDWKSRMFLVNWISAPQIPRVIATLSKPVASSL